MVHLHTLDCRFEKSLCRLLVNHPLIAYLLIFIGLPIGILLAAAIFMVIAVFPLGIMLSWF